MSASDGRRRRRAGGRGREKVEKAPCSYDQACETTRQAVNAAVLQAGTMLDGCEIDQREAVRALAEGGLAATVDGYLRFNAAIGLPLEEIRAELREAVDGYWEQSLATHLEEKRKREVDEASPPDTAFTPGEAPTTIPPALGAFVLPAVEEPDDV